MTDSIRNYTLFLYFNASLYVLQISRVLYFLNDKSIAPLYISLVPMAILLVISREAHMLAAALWFVSFNIIYLQVRSKIQPTGQDSLFMINVLLHLF